MARVEEREAFLSLIVDFWSIALTTTCKGGGT